MPAGLGPLGVNVATVARTNATMSRQIATGGVGATASIERRSCSEKPRLKETFTLCLQVRGRWGGASCLALEPHCRSETASMKGAFTLCLQVWGTLHVL